MTGFDAAVLIKLLTKSTADSLFEHKLLIASFKTKISNC
jgi:hypothetical protein